jgi:hypothetical protein
MSVNDHQYSLRNVPEDLIYLAAEVRLPSSSQNAKMLYSRLVGALKMGVYFILAVYNKASVNNTDRSEERANVPFPGYTQLAHSLEVTRRDE